MVSIYEAERGSYSRTGWKNRKKQLRLMGLKPDQWHRLSYDNVNLDTVSKGMFIQNKSGGPIYKVLDIVYGEVKVIDVKNIGRKNSHKYVKMLKKITVFQWVKKVV